MALTARLRCPVHMCLVGARACTSRAAGSTLKETTASVAQSTTDSSTAGVRAEKGVGSKPLSFEVAHLGNVADRNPEKFIPISRRLLIRRLIEEPSLLSEAQSSKFEQFSLALNQAIAYQMVHHLEDMKHLYDPLDPDKDTLAQHRLTRSEQLDHEFWLLRQLGRVLEKANFQRLPHHMICEELREHDTSEGIRVSVDVNAYDTLQIWTRGRGPGAQEHASRSLPVRLAYRFAKFLRNRIYPPPSGSTDCFRRVVLVARQDNSSKLILKLFRDIPCRRLETLLPDGRVVMSKLDRYLLLTGISSGVITLSVKAIAFLMDTPLNYAWIGFLLLSITSFRAWMAFKNKRNAYLAQLTQTLYFHNVANNRAVLAQLSDRSADEQFKEALLLYTFVLASMAEGTAVSSGKSDISKSIEKWLVQQFKLPADSFQFDMSDAMSSLQRLGLVTERSRDGGLMTTDVAEAILMLRSHTNMAAAAVRPDVMEANDVEIEDGVVTEDADAGGKSHHKVDSPSS